jgi:hypothetical protein
MLAAGGHASAHRAPSPTENNRYARITLLPEGARIAYTVFFGERPGQLERQRMDANRDGVIDDGEARAFSQRLLAEIGPRIEVEVDGRPADLTQWRAVDLGLGTPTVNAGPFSLDLQLLARWPDPRQADHTLWLEDRWPVPSPGETELRVEESPGVRVSESHLRRDGRGAVLEFRFIGAPKGKGDAGVFVRLSVDEEARRQVAPPPRKGLPGWVTILFVMLLVASGAVYAVVERVRRRRQRKV